MTDDVEQLVAYRLGQARETLEAGRALLDAKHYRDAINRAYYAMFYAALGLLASKGLGSSKHTGVVSLFGQHFVSTGSFPVQEAAYLREGFSLRQQCDYREFVEPEPGQTEEILAHAEDFVFEAEKTWKRGRLSGEDRSGGR